MCSKSLLHLYPLCSFMQQLNSDGCTLIVFISASRHRWTHSSNKINVAAVKSEKLDFLVSIKPHILCRKATCRHSNKQMATENRACLLPGDTLLIQHGWMGFLSKIFSVVLDIFPARASAKKEQNCHNRNETDLTMNKVAESKYPQNGMWLITC